jgi:hypothetical protein
MVFIDPASLSPLLDQITTQAAAIVTCLSFLGGILTAAIVAITWKS